MKWFNFILSHSIFISLCASALCFQTYQLLHIAPHYEIYILVFCSTLSSYNLYWLISKYYFTKKRDLISFLIHNLSNLLLFIIASIGIIIIIYILPEVMPFITVAVFLTLLYSLPLWPIKGLLFLRKAGFLKTLLLSFTWTYVTIMIPLHVNMYSLTPGIIILFIARFSFMLMLCTIFDSRDIAVDKIRALRSLATDVSSRSLGIIMGILFFIYLGAGVLLRIYLDNFLQVIAFFITGLVVLLVYRMSLKKQGYIFYYFIVDGLMLFSAMATYLAGI